MKTDLSTSKLKDYNLILSDGEAVVRNQRRINGLLEVRLQNVDSRYRDLLALANFQGALGNESIIWSTDVFATEPKRLSELSEPEHRHYRDILNDTLLTYAKVIAPSEEKIRNLLYSAITYPSESAIFCANDRVVITEWGMQPVGGAPIMGMPYVVEDNSTPLPVPAPNPEFESRSESGDMSTINSDTKDSSDAEKDGSFPCGDGLNQEKKDDSRDAIPGIISISDNSLSDSDGNKPTDDASVAGVQNNVDESTSGGGILDGNSGLSGNHGQEGNNEIRSQQAGGNTDSNSQGAHVDDSGEQGTASGVIGNTTAPLTKKPVSGFRKYWLWLLLAILCLVLLFLLLNKCGTNEAPIVNPISPDIQKEDIVLSEDSLRYIAKDRIIVILTDDNANVEAFAKDFRSKYSDETKYGLSSPDSLVKKLTITLPVDERVKLMEELPAQFAEYGLIVIPETMYKNNDVSNDPALQDGEKRWYFDECSIFEAWNTTMGNEDIVVAIIDDGFDLSHPELEGKVVNPFNAVTHDRNVFPSMTGHGTHVASTAIGNANNSIGSAGVAPGCMFMPIQVGDRNGNMSTSAILDAVIYAINNKADVVNMSLGMYFGPFVQFVPLYIQKNLRDNVFLEEQRVWDHIFSVARQNNVTFVLAAGNENVLVGLDPMQRSANTIKVSATLPDKHKANFSNYGDLSTVSAPGVRIYNAIPHNGYTYMDGTSMAAPIVTGACALLKSQDPSYSVNTLAQVLRETGTASLSDVGPIINLAKALNGEVRDAGDECAEISRRYAELLAELEAIRREHPDCIQTPDTLSLPDDFTINDLVGRWKSTTTLFNSSDEEVVLYFTFDGTSQGRLDIVEPSGEICSANLEVVVEGENVNIDQLTPAEGTTKNYNPYQFVLKPGMDRKAVGRAKNKVEVANIFKFNLIRI